MYLGRLLMIAFLAPNPSHFLHPSPLFLELLNTLVLFLPHSSAGADLCISEA